MLLEKLLRNDCPGYNEALREAFSRDPGLADDEPRATKVALALYERLFSATSEPGDGILRGELLQKIVRSFDPVPVFHRSGRDQAEGWWRVIGILDIVSLSKSEREVLAETFDGLDYVEDTDFGQASFSAIRTRQSETPSVKYQSAALRLARDAAERLLIERLTARNVAVQPPRAAWRAFPDRVRLAIG